MAGIDVRDLGHVNLLTDDYHASMRHVRDVFGARFFAAMYEPEERSTNNLFLIGSTCLEFFAPWDLHSTLGRSLSRRGPGWFALEWRVRSLEDALVAVRDTGIRVTSEVPGSFAWLHPADCGGLLVELAAATFPSDPRESADFSDAPWREHPLGVLGLESVDVAVPDAERSAGFLADLLTGQHVDTAPAEPVGARAAAIRIAGDTYRFLSPTGDGPLQAHLGTRGSGIRSVTFRVADLGSVRDWFRRLALPTVPGDRPDSLGLPAEVNLGFRVEFTESAA